jgi:hypothetical protein
MLYWHDNCRAPFGRQGLPDRLKQQCVESGSKNRWVVAVQVVELVTAREFEGFGCLVRVRADVLNEVSR